uniref:Uncharacterized protein n=1 Tax=Moniliophthora roreri TaxID=221103 RepID=A0A0W0F868_MONRR
MPPRKSNVFIDDEAAISSDDEYEEQDAQVDELDSSDDERGTLVREIQPLRARKDIFADIYKRFVPCPVLDCNWPQSSQSNAHEGAKNLYSLITPLQQQPISDEKLQQDQVVRSFLEKQESFLKHQYQYVKFPDFVYAQAKDYTDLCQAWIAHIGMLREWLDKGDGFEPVPPEYHFASNELRTQEDIEVDPPVSDEKQRQDAIVHLFLKKWALFINHQLESPNFFNLINVNAADFPSLVQTWTTHIGMLGEWLETGEGFKPEALSYEFSSALATLIDNLPARISEDPDVNMVPVTDLDSARNRIMIYNFDGHEIGWHYEDECRNEMFESTGKEVLVPKEIPVSVAICSIPIDSDASSDQEDLLESIFTAARIGSRETYSQIICVDCQCGTEWTSVFAISNAALNWSHPDIPNPILSAYTGAMPGHFYIKLHSGFAFSHLVVLQLLQLVLGVNFSVGLSHAVLPTHNIVPVDEWHSMLFTFSCIASIWFGTWIQVSKGTYQGDMGLVLDDACYRGTSACYVRVLLVPCINLVAWTAGRRQCKRKQKAASQRLEFCRVDVEDLQRHGLDIGTDFKVRCACDPTSSAEDHNENPLQCPNRTIQLGSHTFTAGFEVHDYMVTTLSITSLCPSDLARFFFTSTDFVVQICLEGLPALDTWDFQPGEMVQAVAYKPDPKRYKNDAREEVEIQTRAAEWAQETADVIAMHLFNEDARHQYLSSRHTLQPGLVQVPEVDPLDEPAPHTWCDPWFFTLYESPVKYWGEQQGLQKAGKIPALEDPKQTVIIPHPAIGRDAIGHVTSSLPGRVLVSFNDVVVVISLVALQKVFRTGELVQILHPHRSDAVVCTSDKLERQQEEVPSSALVISVNRSIVALKSNVGEAVYIAHCNTLRQADVMVISDTNLVPTTWSTQQPETAYITEKVLSTLLNTGRPLWVGEQVQITKTAMKGLLFEVHDVICDPTMPSSLKILVKWVHNGITVEKMLDYIYVRQFVTNLFLPILRNPAWQLHQGFQARYEESEQKCFTQGGKAAVEQHGVFMSDAIIDTGIRAENTNDGSVWDAHATNPEDVHVDFCRKVKDGWVFLCSEQNQVGFLAHKGRNKDNALRVEISSLWPSTTRPNLTAEHGLMMITRLDDSGGFFVRRAGHRYPFGVDEPHCGEMIVRVVKPVVWNGKEHLWGEVVQDREFRLPVSNLILIKEDHEDEKAGNQQMKAIREQVANQFSPPLENNSSLEAICSSICDILSSASSSRALPLPAVHKPSLSMSPSAETLSTAQPEGTLAQLPAASSSVSPLMQSSVPLATTSSSPPPTTSSNLLVTTSLAPMLSEIHPESHLSSPPSTPPQC